MRGVEPPPGEPVAPYMARWRATVARHPLLAALGSGICLGPIGILCSFVVSNVVLHLLPPEQWGNSGAAHLDRLDPAMFFFLALVFAPVIETVLGQVLPMEAARRLGAGPAAQILLSGLVWGCGHYASGGLVHGITAVFGGLVFACGYAALRPAGIRPAYVAAASAHATQNGIIWALMVSAAAA